MKAKERINIELPEQTEFNFEFNIPKNQLGNSLFESQR